MYKPLSGTWRRPARPSASLPRARATCRPLRERHHAPPRGQRWRPPYRQAPPRSPGRAAHLPHAEVPNRRGASSHRRSEVNAAVAVEASEWFEFENAKAGGDRTRLSGRADGGVVDFEAKGVGESDVGSLVCAHPRCWLQRREEDRAPVAYLELGMDAERAVAALRKGPTCSAWTDNNMRRMVDCLQFRERHWRRWICCSRRCRVETRFNVLIFAKRGSQSWWPAVPAALGLIVVVQLHADLLDELVPVVLEVACELVTCPLTPRSRSSRCPKPCHRCGRRG